FDLTVKDFKLNPGKIGGNKLHDLGLGLVKDASKALAKAYLDVAVRQAWFEYYMKDAVAAAYQPYFEQVSRAYWERSKGYRALMLKKAKLVEGYDPISGVRTALDASFPAHSTLKITATVARPPGATAPHDIHALVAGSDATNSGPFTWTISAENLRPGPS